MKSAEVQARDASKLGMRIICPVDLPVGTTVYIEGKDGQIRGYCTVRHCAASNQNYSIGLEYDEETRARLDVQPGPDLDYYEFLQISPKAESGTIQRIYRFMAGRFHPDNPETGDPEKFLLLNQVYEVLSDPDRRAQYDAEREAHDPDIRPNPIFELSEFVNGVEGEVNRRLGVLSLLYNQRRTNSENPAISLYDIEKRMGWPR